MKCRCATFLAVLGILCALAMFFADPAGAARYVTRHPSSVGGAGLGPPLKVNASGEIAWIGNYYDSPGLYLATRGVVRKLTANGDIQNLDLNDLGEVVWSENTANGYNLFLFRNGTVSQVTTDGNNNFDPSMNSLGDFVWNTYDGVKARVKHRTAGGVVTTVFTCPAASDINIFDVRPVVNNLGQTAWVYYTMDNQAHMYLTTGGVPTEVRSWPVDYFMGSAFTEPLYTLTNTGDLIFAASDGIWLKRAGSAVQKLASSSNLTYRPRMNDAGIAAFVGDRSPTDPTPVVYLYGPQGLKPVGDPGVYPALNKGGAVAWSDGEAIRVYENGATGTIAPCDFSAHLEMGGGNYISWQGLYSGDGVWLAQRAAPPQNLLLLLP